MISKDYRAYLPDKEKLDRLMDIRDTFENIKNDEAARILCLRKEK